MTTVDRSDKHAEKLRELMTACSLDEIILAKQSMLSVSQVRELLCISALEGKSSFYSDTIKAQVGLRITQKLIQKLVPQ